MQAVRLATRLQRELRMLQTDPPPGVGAWPCKDSISHLEAQIEGPDDSVYAKGTFKLEVRVPERYPFEPPNVRFMTPIYHPNIDSGGRICLDILNMPPKGAWKPSLNIPTILASIGLLLAEPNPDDGLMGDITEEYKHSRGSFDVTARKWTQQYAVQTVAEHGNPQIGHSLQPDVGDQEISAGKITETTPHARNSRTASIGHAVFECRQDSAREALKGSAQTPANATGKIEAIPSQISSSQRLNLSMRLARDKGAKGVENPSTADTAAASGPSAGNPSADSAHATRQSSVQEMKGKTLLGSSPIGTGLDNEAPVAQNRLSGPSSSGGNTGLLASTEKPNHLASSKEGHAVKRGSKVPPTASIDLRKFQRQGEITRITAPAEGVSLAMEQQTRTNSPSSAIPASPAGPVIRRTNTVDRNEGQSPSRPSLSASKLSRVENSNEGSRLGEAEDLSRETADRSGSKVAPFTTVAASGIPQQSSVCMGGSPEAQKLTLRPSKPFRDDGSRHLEEGADILQQTPVRMDRTQAARSNPSKRFRDETSKQSLGPLEVDYLSRDPAKRSRSSKIPASIERTEILNQQAECGDRITGQSQKVVATVSRHDISIPKSGRLETESLSSETSSSTKAGSPQSPGILNPKAKSIGSIRRVEGHESSFHEPTSTVPTKVRTPEESGPGHPTTLNPTPRLSKVFVQECTEAVVGPEKNSERPSTGITKKAELKKKARQVNPAALIVLDSESDDELPQGRSRLSLAKMKGMRRK